MCDGLERERERERWGGSTEETYQFSLRKKRINFLYGRNVSIFFSYIGINDIVPSYMLFENILIYLKNSALIGTKMRGSDGLWAKETFGGEVAGLNPWPGRISADR